MIGLGFHLVIVCLLVTSSEQTDIGVKETTDVTSPTDTTADVGPTVPINETDLQKTFRELEDEITSPHCKMVLKDRANVLTSFSEACCMLISFQTTLVPLMCTQLEYDRAHDVLCVNVTCPTTTAPPEHVTNASQTSTEHKEKVLCIIDTQLSSDSCRATARQQAEGESEQGHACETLKSFQSALDAIGCSKQDYDTLYSVICDDVDTTCVREDPLQAVINTLTFRCKSTMSAGWKELKSPGGCSTLESSRTTILTTNICTLGDYNRLHGILCSQDKLDPNQVLSQGVKFDNAINTVQTKISQSCHEIVWKDLEKSDYNLDPVCQKLKSSGQGLRVKGLCTQADLDTLEPAVCIGHRVYDQKEQELRTKIHQVIEELGDRCKETMLEQERQMEDTTVESACVKLKASHSALLNTQVCSEAEIGRLSPLLCGNTAVLLQANLLVLLAASIFTLRQLLL
ncbi:uncharacterized protein LOC131944958 [Physella acuta]|uniref:uncharacterized protein LOC131944958 n=1 Tax=Physella acuta TaxID=109671 RepID=UPI0027DB830F|nr:uncharacterized protein LOC131944958 [Physella acuta]